MALAAAKAIADVVGEDKINATVIVPSVFDARVAPAVRRAPSAAAITSDPAADQPPDPGPVPSLSADRSRRSGRRPLSRGRSERGVVVACRRR